MLDKDMQRVVDEQGLGYVALVCRDAEPVAEGDATAVYSVTRRRNR